MRGKVIYCGKQSFFAQIDKNNQLCGLYTFDKKEEYSKRIGERVLPEVMNEFRGRPLYSNWNAIIERIQQIVKSNEEA